MRRRPQVPAGVWARGSERRSDALSGVAGYLAACTFLVVYLEFATPPFVEEYDKRPDRVFIEYLVYPKEVFTMLWANHKLGLVGVPIVAGVAAGLAWRTSRAVLATSPAWGSLRRLLALPLVILVLVVGARSSVDPSILAPSDWYRRLIS